MGQGPKNEKVMLKSEYRMLNREQGMRPLFQFKISNNKRLFAVLCGQIVAASVFGTTY